jgi:hypothetical protein
MKIIVRQQHLLVAAVFSFCGPAWATRIVVGSIVPEPAPLGSAIQLEPGDLSGWDGHAWFRYRIRYPDEAEFRVVRDFSPRASFEWWPSVTDGPYDIELTARNLDTAEVRVYTSKLEITSRVVGNTPVITPTANELVFLYSAPPCAVGKRIAVSFAAPNAQPQSTPAMQCRNGRSMNLYLAGMQAETEYSVRHTIFGQDGSTEAGPLMTLRTGTLSFNPAPTHPSRNRRAVPPVRSPLKSRASEQPILFQNRLFEFSVATDIDGNVIWFLPQNLPFLTRPQPGGYFFVLIEDPRGSDADQILREIDLAGNVVFETNVAVVNERLAAMGRKRINSFHHEARRLPDGKILVLAGNERLLTGVQGNGEVNVLGDAILVLDSELQVVWAWDAFDHLDAARKASQDEKCEVGQGGCPVFHLTETANDWLHGNSLALTPDGHILYSIRHQDWVIKIDFNHGAGSGQVIWRLGKDGDFVMISDEEEPWFSHQHDASIVQVEGADRVLLLDNSNARALANENANSRGQLIELDEVNRTARLVLNLDLGRHAFALGSAQRMDNGHFVFNVGYDADGHSTIPEFDENGMLVGRYNVPTTIYRTLRMRDLYTP